MRTWNLTTLLRGPRAQRTPTTLTPAPAPQDNTWAPLPDDVAEWMGMNPYAPAASEQLTA
ncbi:MAG: hypothetical protein ACXVWZ_12895 [Nocardioides sp.]